MKLRKNSVRLRTAVQNTVGAVIHKLYGVRAGGTLYTHRLTKEQTQEEFSRLYSDCSVYFEANVYRIESGRETLYVFTCPKQLSNFASTLSITTPAQAKVDQSRRFC